MISSDRKSGQLHTGKKEKVSIMREIMMDGEMMWGMGFVGWLVLLLVILAIAALVKYLFFN